MSSVLTRLFELPTEKGSWKKESNYDEATEKRSISESSIAPSVQGLIGKIGSTEKDRCDNVRVKIEC